jgi:hypothetical protein
MGSFRSRIIPQKRNLRKKIEKRRVEGVYMRDTYLVRLTISSFLNHCYHCHHVTTVTVTTVTTVAVITIVTTIHCHHTTTHHCHLSPLAPLTTHHSPRSPFPVATATTVTTATAVAAHHWHHCTTVTTAPVITTVPPKGSQKHWKAQPIGVWRAVSLMLSLVKRWKKPLHIRCWSCSCGENSVCTTTECFGSVHGVGCVVGNSTVCVHAQNSDAWVFACACCVAMCDWICPAHYTPTHSTQIRRDIGASLTLRVRHTLRKSMHISRTLSVFAMEYIEKFTEELKAHCSFAASDSSRQLLKTSQVCRLVSRSIERLTVHRCGALNIFANLVWQPRMTCFGILERLNFQKIVLSTKTHTHTLRVCVVVWWRCVYDTASRWQNNLLKVESCTLFMHSKWGINIVGELEIGLKSGHSVDSAAFCQFLHYLIRKPLIALISFGHATFVLSSCAMIPKYRAVKTDKMQESLHEIRFVTSAPLANFGRFLNSIIGFF